MVGRASIEKASILWLLAIFVTFGLQAQDEIFFGGFETGGSCLWSLSVTPDFCDGLDNDCDLVIDEDAACDDDLDCTQDSCEASGCEFLTDSGSCIIDGQCFSSGVLNPSNSCQVCDPNESQTEWTAVSDGTACGDLECNECGSGVCISSTLGLPGPGCSDSTNSGCDNPDTCEAGGICQRNYVAPGTACGGGVNEPICDPDICDGSGNCTNVAWASDGTPCGGLVCEECQTGVCAGVSICGDGSLCAATETCDDGFVDDCGTCNATCDGPGNGSTCGDGIVCGESEICDDGNTDACGTCNATCLGAGSGQCSTGTGCVSGGDCLSGVCSLGFCE